ncbi:enoyl-CoA hydratase/isomerase family protein [Marinilongibacter aquaticus]|uniref:enoyl-CoA hydratase/isomerase family protein n=1 Tax=Marinilongibacter aquaticus TaxID=2975157 RepID=UPI0021BD3117|nr:enoyl-CoA hydratase-related protein [Marinilongibacter aquaticus]UBM60602.1 enoyl-CoA hydratase/isomerase family protein [Marinilongibacter aquaticus]
MENIRFKKHNGIATVALNRPEVYNALNAAMLRELAQVIADCGRDKSIRVLVLESANPNVFCSGADLKEGLQDSQKSLGEVLKENYEPVILGLRMLPKPVICKISGLAVGAGMSLALACDMIVAEEEAYMSELFVGIGLMPDAGSMYFLPRMVGFQKAFELMSSGRKIYMKEALTLGLVTQVVPKEQLDQVVEGMAIMYAGAATKAIGEMKMVLNQSHNRSLQEVLELEALGQTSCGLSSDFKRGVMAFLNKTKPEFRGD